MPSSSVAVSCRGQRDPRHGRRTGHEPHGWAQQENPLDVRDMLTATLAIAGAPGFSGFFSKDAILLAAADNYWLYGFGLLTALLTSFYMFRLIFLAFHGKQRFDDHKVHVHESPRSMLVRS